MKITERHFLFLGLCTTLVAVSITLADDQAAPPQREAPPTQMPASKEQRTPATVAPPAFPLGGSLRNLSNQIRSRTQVAPATAPMATPMDVEQRQKERTKIGAPKGLGLSGGILKKRDRTMSAAPKMHFELGLDSWTPPDRQIVKAPRPREPEWHVFEARPIAEAPPAAPRPTLRHWETRTAFVVSVCRSCRGLRRANQNRSSPGIGFALPELIR